MRVIAIDFDGTAFDTSADSPSGLNVPVAYEQAIKTLYGTDVLGWYRQSGGLMNRSPGEVIDAICSHFTAEMLETGFSEQPKSYNVAHRAIDFSRQYGEDGARRLATEQLVLEKLQTLLPEIGKQFPDGAFWPQPMPGFLEFWKRVSGDSNICTMILSSGHERFISCVFELYRLKQPDTMVTDDHVRNLAEPFSKPDPRFFEMGMTALRERYPISAEAEALYFGDDPKKDGNLAQNVGIPFCHFDRTGLSTERFSFSDWAQTPMPFGSMADE